MRSAKTLRRPIELTVKAHANTYRTASEIFS